MKPSVQTQTRAFTLVEVLVVIACLAVLVALLMPSISRPEGKANRITCVNNLKNIGLAFRIHPTLAKGAGYPFQIPLEWGGTKELTEDTSQIWRNWAALSNQLGSPKTLACPSDKQRGGAASFTSGANVPTQFVFSGNHQISYFLSLDASEEQPQGILAGDRNVTTNGIPIGPGRQVIWAGIKLGFTEQMHNHAGNLLLGDGSVQQVTDGRFTEQFADALKSTGLTTNVWLVP